MPKAYTTYELQQVYETIALKRAHKCNSCATPQRISHSHIVPKGRNPRIAIIEKNIVYHCMTLGFTKGCHENFEGMDAPMNGDFEQCFRIMHELDREYFWIRIQKLDEYWSARKKEVWLRVRALLTEIDKLEHGNRS